MIFLWQILIMFGLLSFKLFRWFKSDLQSSFSMTCLSDQTSNTDFFPPGICFCFDFAHNGFLFENQNRQKKVKTHFVVISMTICQAELSESHETVNFVIHCADHPFKSSANFHDFWPLPPSVGKFGQFLTPPALWDWKNYQSWFWIFQI